MHIHAPRAHDWRDAVREIGIIVVGILVALFLEQLVQRWEWREKVRTAEAAMHRELFFDNGPQVYGRAVAHPCLRQRLDAIHTAVHSGKGRDEVADLIAGVQVDFTSYDSLAIQSAFASDVAAHMPQERLDAYIQAYQMIPTMDRTNTLEAADLARLRSIPRTGGALTEDERNRVLEAVEALRIRDGMMFIAARWTLPAMRRLGGALDRDRKQRFMNFARHYYGACARDLPPDWAPQSPFHPDNYRPGQQLIEE